jgi:hypothetical protein
VTTKVRPRERRRAPILGGTSALAALAFWLGADVASAEDTPPHEVSALEPAPDDEEELTFEATAEVNAPEQEPTKRTLEKEQLTTTPGARGDALRAIEVLPGVSRTQFGTNPGPPLLRGSPGTESAVLIDGSAVPLLYHFGGLTSVVNSHLIESVTLYPGNYSARYGRVAGGVVDVRIRDPRVDAPHALLELSLIDSSAVVEMPLGKSTGLALGARRSNVEPFLDALITDDSATVIAAPVYWDYQAVLQHRLDVDHELRLVAYASHDAFELAFGEAMAEDPALRGGFGSKTTFHRFQLECDSRPSDDIRQTLMIGTGPHWGTGSLGPVDYDYTSWESTARADWSLLLTPWLSLGTGLDAALVDVTYEYGGPPPPPDDGIPAPGALAAQGGVEVEGTLEALRSGVYVEALVRPLERWLLVPGVRVDYVSDSDAVTVDPRLSSRLGLTEDTTFKAGVGAYSQPPQYWEVMGFGNPALDPFRAIHASVGAEQFLRQGVRADLDLFYKRWMDRVVGTPGGAPPRFVNGGTGDAYGLEFQLDVELEDRTRGILAYTLSRSVRRDAPDQPERLFDDDQTHNLSIAQNVDLGSGWLVGGRFRYVTGSPYSEVVGAVYDAPSDTYRPLYGEVNGARNPAFHQLDLRVEKLWDTGPMELTAYLEVMNVYNQQNQEALRYSFDYQESTSVSGLPFFPNLGVRGAL